MNDPSRLSPETSLIYCIIIFCPPAPSRRREN